MVEANEFDSPHVLSQRRAVYSRNLWAQPYAVLSRFSDAQRFPKRRKTTGEQPSLGREKKLMEVIDLCGEESEVQIAEGSGNKNEKEKEKEKEKEGEKTGEKRDQGVAFDLPNGLLQVVSSEMWEKKGKMWVTRELKALLEIADVHIIVLVVGKALEGFRAHRTFSVLLEELQEYLPAEDVELFLHELYCFLSSPYYTLRDYDRAVRYVQPL